MSRPTLRRLGGAALVVGAAVALATASTAAGPVRPTTPAAVPLSVTPRTATVVCPGPESLAVPDGAAAVAPGGPVTLSVAVAGGAPGAATPAVDAAVTPVARAGKPVPVRAAAEAVGVGSVGLIAAGAVGLTGRTPSGGQAPLTGGVQQTLARTGDLRGLVARQCAPASTQSWLVGSGTGQGRRSRLLVANPTPAPATVDVRVLTPDGPVDPPNGQGVVVPAHSQTALLVDALVPGSERVAVRVLARSGRVVTTLQDSLLRGLVPGGADDVVAGADPGKRQVVPGLDVRESAVTDGPARLPADPGDPGAVAVRVAVPGGEDAVVKVKLLGPRGVIELPAGIVDVPAGTVADVPVTGVPDGVYSAAVEADVPVLAGAVVGRAAKGSELAGTPDGVAVDVPPAEFAWAAATAPLTTTLLPLPSGVAARLVLTAPASAGAVKVTPVSSTGVLGRAEAVRLVAGRTTGVQLPTDASAIFLQPHGGPVHAAVTLEAADRRGDLVSVVSIEPPLSSTRSSLPVVERPRLH